MHVGTPFMTMGQGVVQLEQWSAFDVTSTHEPLQFVRFGPHAVVQTRWLHTWLLMHGVVHPPQCAKSLVVSISQPFAGCPSQSARPISHMPTAHAPAWQIAVA